MNTYKVGIVGLGKIVTGYAKASDPNPYSHAGGLRDCEGVQLAAVADPLPAARETFSAEWAPLLGGSDIAYYEDGLELVREAALDVVVLCVKGPLHHRFVMETIRSSPARVIFLEKPAGCSMREIDEMTSAARKAGKLIVVDYTRHWAPHMYHLQQKVRAGLIGDVLSVTGYCGGTLVLSETSHTVDTVCQFAGYDVKEVAAFTAPGQPSPKDGYHPEPLMESGIMRFESGVLGLLNGRLGPKVGFCAEVLGTEGSLVAGMYVPTQWRDKEGRSLPLEELALPPEAGPFKLAYEQIRDYLDTGKIPECSEEQYVPVSETTFAICESGKTGRVVTLPMTDRDTLIYADG